MSDKLQLILESAAFGVFKEYCKGDLSEERCGLFLLADGRVSFVPCDNSAYDKKNSFLIHPVDFVKAMDAGDVIGVGHSHITVPARPSTEDMTNAENCKLPFVIYQPDLDEVDHYVPTGEPLPLIGRKWHLGVSDCYTIVRDYYKTLGIELKDYVRNDQECLYRHSMFLDHYEENGFVDVTGQTPKLHDVLFIQVMADIPNHAAVMVSDSLILHHIQGRLSCRDPYGGYWRRHTAKVVRHKTWL